MSSSSQSKASFHGCYLLVNVKKRTYVGYTVDPSRRIKQHNAGSQKGGAKKTSDRGPWDMTLITHGFLNEISALRFEWAWQKPDKSRRLKSVGLKKQARESQFNFRLRVLNTMLNTAPWRHLPLTVQWLDQKYVTPLPSSIPSQMTVVDPPMEPITPEFTHVNMSDIPCAPTPCNLCSESITTDFKLVFCPCDDCHSAFHNNCLADHFREDPDIIIPYSTTCSCPKCHTIVTWDKVVKFKRAYTGLKSNNR